MSKPRIFLSSTCYDLEDARARLTTFLESYGFEVINSQKPSFGVMPRKHSHTACLEQVKNADYMVLIIGSRAGGLYVGSTGTITNEEYSAAVKRGVIVIPFVKKAVFSAEQLYKKNPTGDFSTVVDDRRIFHFVEFILSGQEDNWLHQFETVEDIEAALRSQFAFYLLTFAQGLRKQEKEPQAEAAIVAFPSDLSGLERVTKDQMQLASYRNGLRIVHSKIREILGASTSGDGKLQKLKTLWVFAAHGESEDSHLKISGNVFRDHAWGPTKSKRVFDAMKPFGLITSVDPDTHELHLWFKGLAGEGGADAVGAIDLWVKELVGLHGEKNAFEMFKSADMRNFAF